MQCLVMLSDKKYIYIYLWFEKQQLKTKFAYINLIHFWRLLKSKFINSISIFTAYKHLNNWAGTTLQTMLKDINLHWVCTNFRINISLMSWNWHFSKTVFTNLMNSIYNYVINF
jgi:hypothetical protein